jgi:hypothetical protein
MNSERQQGPAARVLISMRSTKEEAVEKGHYGEKKKGADVNYTKNY